MPGLIDHRQVNSLRRPYGSLIGEVAKMMQDHQSMIRLVGDSSPHWSLLKLNPQKQRGYMELLGEYYPGIESYYPVYKKVIRPHGQRKAKSVTRPVYPGYVFMRVGAEHIRGPTTLPVVARWVRFGGNIECIPDTVIQRLRHLEAANELVREIRYVNPYRPGVRVRVHLPIGDIFAIVVQCCGNHVLVNSPLCRVKVPRHLLQVA